MKIEAAIKDVREVCATLLQRERGYEERAVSLREKANMIREEREVLEAMVDSWEKTQETQAVNDR